MKEPKKPNGCSLEAWENREYIVEAIGKLTEPMSREGICKFLANNRICYVTPRAISALVMWYTEQHRLPVIVANDNGFKGTTDRVEVEQYIRQIRARAMGILVRAKNYKVVMKKLDPQREFEI